MFYNTNDNGEDSVPSWLQNDNTVMESTPLMGVKKVAKPSRKLDIEEDYDGSISNDNINDNPAWAEHDSSSPIGNPKEEESISLEEEYSSSDEEEVEEEEEELEEEIESINNRSVDKKKKKKRFKQPKRNCCHNIFVGLQVIAILGDLLMIASQVTPMFICKIGTVQGAVRCYLALFSFIFFLTEVSERITSPFLQNWIYRGFLYTFLGVVGLEQRDAMILNGALDSEKPLYFYNISWSVKWTSFFILISSWWMISVGCAYFLFGSCCLQPKLAKYREQYQTQIQNYKRTLHD